MRTDTSSFDNYPIEFKEVNPEDFKLVFRLEDSPIQRDGFEIENNGKKIIIEPDSQTGFINEAFQENILLEHKNTVVVNAAVGQGKSYAVIQTIKRFYDSMKDGGKKYLIVVASPFVSLVKQYCDDIHKEAEIPINQIYNYDNLGRNNRITYLDKAVQVVTANTLLGNPGEDGFKNSDIKRKYLNELINHCKTTNTKVVFIYDEIHDSYHNFKEEYIFNLWKWRDVIHKNFILSASYNEASKVIIEYLAELTNRKIKIIESKRVRFPHKQSSLHLHYSPANRYSHETPEIVNLVKDLVSKDKNIDILCYSKNLAKSLINPTDEIGRILRDAYGEVKDCTSELVFGQRTVNEDPKNQFDNSMCNVGTNFKTGISIKKKNHAYIIILPPRSTRLWFRNKYGIFSGGINSIIQALARQRVKGEIHIVLPKPDRFNYESLQYSDMTDEQKAQFHDLYEPVTYFREPEKPVSYIKLNRQDMLLLRNFYEGSLYENLEDEILHIKEMGPDRIDMPTLRFPTYEQFKLHHGEDYIANNYPFFGEDISAYMTYAAISNQFVNCRLKEVNMMPTLFFMGGKVLENLSQYYMQYFGEDHLHFHREYSNFSMYYYEVKDALNNEFELKYRKDRDSKYQRIAQYSNKYKEFEVQLLQFIATMYYGSDYEYTNFGSGSETVYSRRLHFLGSIRLSQLEHNDSISNERRRFYVLLGHFRLKLIDSILDYTTSRSNFSYVYKKHPQSFFTEDDILKFRELESLLQSDILLANNIFEFKRRFENKTLEDKLKSFYTILCEDFFISEPIKLSTGRRRQVYKVDAIHQLPYSTNIINLVAPQEYKIDNLENKLQADINRAGGE